MSDASNNDSTLLEEARTLPNYGERLAFLKAGCQGDEERFVELKLCKLTIVLVIVGITLELL